MTCKSFGRPEPVVTWATEILEKDRYSVTTEVTDSVEGFTVTSVLVINSTVYSDTGVFNCTTINTANGEDHDLVKDSASIHVTVLSMYIFCFSTSCYTYSLFFSPTCIECDPPYQYCSYYRR